MESMPFTGTDEIHMRAPTCKYADSKSGFNDMVGIEIRYRQGNLAVFFYFGWRRHSRIVSLPHGESVRRHSPSFPWKEVPRRGGGWHRSEMKIVRGAVFSYRHPERSRGIFFVCRVPFPVWNGLHETPFLGAQGVRCFPLAVPLTSFALPRTKKISRFRSK